MARSTLTGKRAEEARDLFDAGNGCNAIARAMGIDPATVSRWAADVGVKFDRSQTAMAVRAHTIDMTLRMPGHGPGHTYLQASTPPQAPR